MELSRVISLPNSDRRQTFFSQPYAERFEVFDAIDGRTDRLDDLVNTQRLAAASSSEPTPGQLGCTASHWKVVTEFARADGDLGDLLLVCEDDVEFFPDSEEAISRIASFAAEYDVVVMSDGWSRLPGRPELRKTQMAIRQPSLLSHRVRTRSTSHRVGRFSGRLWWASLYFISRRGARKLLEFTADDSHRTHWIADDWNYLRDKAGLDIAATCPSLVITDGDSTTQPHLRSGTPTVDEQDAADVRSGRIAHPLAPRSRAGAFSKIIAATVRDVRFRIARKSR